MKQTFLRLSFLMAFSWGIFVLPVMAQTGLPDGAGKEQVERVCTVCHTMDTVTATHRDRLGWQMVIEDMQTRGAVGSDRDFVEILNYLTKNLGPETAPAKNTGSAQAAEAAPAAAQNQAPKGSETTAKININQASAAELMSELKLSQEGASEVIRYRQTHGAIKDWDTLKHIPGVDAKQLEAYRDRLDFQATATKEESPAAKPRQQ